jgi:hypothetical protein
LTGARLASCGYDKQGNKRRRLELHGPDEAIDFEFTGKLWVIKYLIYRHVTDGGMWIIGDL